MSGIDRFDAGHDIVWTPAPGNAVTGTIGTLLSLYDFDPTLGPRYLRVDYMSINLIFGLLDLNAGASIYFTPGDFGTPVPILSVAIGSVATDSHLRATAQLSQPFYVTARSSFSLDGSTSGADTSLMSAAIAVSTGWAREI